MPRVGMIGGLGPESTLDYYQLLIETYRNKTKSEGSPEIIIYSMDINIILKFMENQEWDNLVQCLTSAIEMLYKAGVDFAFISANTPHIVFDRVNELSPIPLLSIVEQTCKYIQKSRVKKVGLLGTKFTMQSDFYEKECNKNNIQLFIPNAKEQEYIHNKLMTEIELGNFFDETRKGLVDIIKRMIDDNSIEGIILGCTELPLILKGNELDIPFFNTTKIHVESVIKYYIDISDTNK